MAVANITLCGHPYDILCQAGQEDIVIGLSHAVDAKAQAILRQVGAVGEAKLLAMVCLSLMSELNASSSSSQQQSPPDAPVAPKVETRFVETGIPAQALAGYDDVLARGVDSLAARIEAIADRLQKA